MTEIENRIEEARNRILNPIRPDFFGKNILAAIRDFNAACDDFRRWARDNPPPIPPERFRSESKQTIHKIRWTEDGKRIEFVG